MRKNRNRLNILLFTVSRNAAPFAMCKGTSSFPRFMHREWLSLMPGLDPADKDLAMAELKLAMELEPAAHPADAEEVYAQLLEQQGQ